MDFDAVCLYEGRMSWSGWTLNPLPISNQVKVIWYNFFICRIGKLLIYVPTNKNHQDYFF